MSHDDPGMESNVRLGRIAGIGVGTSWSVLVIFWLIAWGLAADVLPSAAPGHGLATYWMVGALTAAAFLGCLLAHEMAHAITAQRAGIEVEGITLWMLGGVSRMRQEATTAADELRIAVIGPATSAALGAGIGALAMLLGLASAPELAVGALGWLAGINLLLAAFNLLPAFPLDGGRVLRAILWARSGDPVAATAKAAATGRTFGYVLIGLGIFGAAGGAGFAGIWLVLLGWVILSEAGAEQAGFQLRRMLRGVTVAEVMSPDPVTVPASITVDELVRDYVGRCRYSSFPVIGDDGAPAGLVTLGAVRRLPDRARRTTTVASVATPMSDVPTAAPDELLLSLIQRFRSGRVPRGQRVLVLDRGAVVGIVSTSDIHRAVEIAELTPETSRT